MAQGIFRGGFRFTYSVAKVITFYCCTYFVFYFWPQFLGRVVMPDYAEPMQVIAGSLFTPLGSLFAGGYFGKRVVMAHVLLLAAAIVVTWLTWPADVQMTPPELNSRFAPTMIVTFAVGAVVGIRRELQRAPVDEE